MEITRLEKALRPYLDGATGSRYNVSDVMSLVQPGEHCGHIYRKMDASRAEIEQAIVNTVSYVDTFDYPLTTAEIHRYLIKLPLSSGKLQESLNKSTLIPHRLQRVGKYYMLPGREAIAAVREERRVRAERLWPEAVYYGRLIARMPFVRMVAVTGSLAVNNVGPQEDIDYFIVTANDRLWVCRAFVILIVRWAARRAVMLCPNYFLAERALRIQTRNLYTAHEITQMLPLFGLPVYHTLRRLNPWTHRFLPNACDAPVIPGYVKDALEEPLPATNNHFLEHLLNTPVGRRIDQLEMSRKIRRFQHVYPGSQEAEFSPNYCKGHFNHHQQRTIQAYEQLVGDMSDEREHPEMPVKEPAKQVPV